MRPMTRSSGIEHVAVLGMLAALGGSFWRPDAPWHLPLMVGSIVLLSLASRSQSATVTRHSVRYWLAPAIILGMAAQFVYFARPDDRVRMGLVAAGLTLAAIGLLVVRRPRS